MLTIQFDIKQFNTLKKILLRLNKNQFSKSLQLEIDNYFKETKSVNILLIEYELLNQDYGITIADIKKLSTIRPHLYEDLLNNDIISQTSFRDHPAQILKKENKLLLSILNQCNLYFESFKQNSSQNLETEMINDLKGKINELGEFYKHYNRKEKLIFPLMERYGNSNTPRIMWKENDQIRALYKALKYQITQLPNLDIEHAMTTFTKFKTKFEEMVFQEEALFIPVLQAIFDEKDWLVIAKESTAFGYAFIEPENEWMIKMENKYSTQNEKIKQNKIISRSKNIRFGAGYLTIEEADMVLNNLPLEITFVDKNSVFKYFNEMTKASEMMLVRTPVSIGRNVANCHPPKSLSKVMTLVRDLKAKRRTSETMWFKMKGQYIHITYKSLFDEHDEFIGILEYVQDIQSFFNLPSEIKRELSPLREKITK